MKTLSVVNLQKAVGANADGQLGEETLTKTFLKLGASLARAQELGLAANVHFKTYQILDNDLRFCHLMAQLTHESGGFKYMEEIASGSAYEGRKDLGNTMPGDGVRYKGRGPIQLTGRVNYRRYGKALGIDFENNPLIVALPSIGLLVACKYWNDKKLNELADKDDVVAISKLINGGLNGIDDRKQQLAKIKSWLTSK